MMGSWLEDAELRQRKIKGKSASLAGKIEAKKISIQENYNANAEAYDGFIKILFNLVRRVNELPEEFREPFNKLRASSKKTRLNNHMNIFASSQRMYKRSFFSLSWFKPVHAKHIRVLYVYLAKEIGLLTFEFKENYLKRKRISANASEKTADNKKSDAEQSTHVKFKYPINQLDEKAGLQIIDWLVYKSDLEELSIWKQVPAGQKVHI